jgi:hypothetical protein
MYAAKPVDKPSTSYCPIDPAATPEPFVSNGTDSGSQPPGHSAIAALKMWAIGRAFIRSNPV